MPNMAMKLGFRYSILAFLGLSAVAGVLGQAADAVSGLETFSQTAERFGLWAALVLVLVGAALWYAYTQACFVQNTLVELVRQNQQCLDRVSNAIRNAPCGEGLHDSDRDREMDMDEQESMSHQHPVIARRRERQAKQEG